MTGHGDRILLHNGVEAMNVWPYIALAFAGYLLGNIQTGLIVARVAGNIDIRKFGSGNAGTTNIARVMGPVPSAITFLIDAGKGALAAYIGLVWMGRVGAVVCALCAVAGHNWPVFFGFRGGKGLATTIGAVLVVLPLPGAVLLLLCAATVLISRRVSVAALVYFTAGLAYGLIFCRNQPSILIFLTLLCAMGWYSHRSNIKRMLAGEEKIVTFGSMEQLKAATRSVSTRASNAYRRSRFHRYTTLHLRSRRKGDRRKRRRERTQPV